MFQSGELIQIDHRSAFSSQQMLLNADISTRIFVPMRLLLMYVLLVLLMLRSMQMKDLDPGFDMEMDLLDRSKQLNSLTIQELTMK